MRSALRLTMVFTIALCTVGAYTSIANFINAAHSAAWPSTNGMIVQSETVEIANAGDPLTGGFMNYEAFVRYSFTHEGREFSSWTISFPNPAHFPDAGSASRFLQSYPVGNEVVVFFNPEDPSTSCLVRESASLTATVGILLMMTCIIALCVFGFSAIPASARHDAQS